MPKSTLIVVAAALLLGGTSLASAKTRAADGAHSKALPNINEVTPRPTLADPYYRLSDSYYGSSDPYRGLLDFFAVPPYSPGNAYRHVRPVGRP